HQRVAKLQPVVARSLFCTRIPFLHRMAVAIFPSRAWRCLMSGKQRRQKKLKAKKDKQGRARRKRVSAEIANLPDPRAMEKVMRGVVSQFEGEPTDTPLHRAQDLIYEAVDQE